jgi:hypothetical protein
MNSTPWRQLLGYMYNNLFRNRRVSKEKTTMFLVESSWNVMAHGEAREGKWRENWRMEWVSSTFHSTSEHGVSSITTITTADTHTSAASSRLNWRHPADLKGLVRFDERRNLVSARVPSHFKHSQPFHYLICFVIKFSTLTRLILRHTNSKCEYK